MALLAIDRFGLRSASPAEMEFHAWEKTPLGAYKQVKKSYFLNEGLCKNVVDVLNAMSTNEPPSKWALSHTTASTFACFPATVIPQGATQSVSEFSDESSGEETRDPRSTRRQGTSAIHGATVATLDQQAKCSEQARKKFIELGYAHKSMTGYESHYNSRLNKCFVDISTTDTQVTPGTIWNNRSVLDAFESKEYATYAWHTEEGKKYWEVAPFQCEVLLPSGERQFCKSDAEFTLLIAMYMQDNE